MYTKKKRSMFKENLSVVILCLGAILTILTILMDSQWSEELFPRLEYFFKRALFPEPSDTYYSLYLFPKPLRLLGRVLVFLHFEWLIHLYRSTKEFASGPYRGIHFILS